MLNFYLLMNSNHLTTYRAYRKHGHLDLRAQIDVLDQLSEHTESYSELSDEVDQGLISLVDKSTYSKLVKSGRARERKKKAKANRGHAITFLDTRLSASISAVPKIVS